MDESINQTLAMHREPRLFGIEAARGVAAMLVVFYHAARHLRTDVGYLPWGGISQFGHAGVDFFFVLSGFIIFFVHGKDLGSPAALQRYTERRFTRIYPYYWVSLIVAALLLLGSGKHGAIDPIFFLRSATLLPLGGDVGVAWTLQHELFFYLFFALAIFNRRIGQIGFCTWLALVVGVWLVNIPMPATAPSPSSSPSSSWQPLWERLTSPFNLEFFFGMFAAWVVRGRHWTDGKALLLLGVVIFLGFGIAENMGFFDGYGPIAQLAYGMSAMLIVIGIATAESTGRLSVPVLWVRLGAASYSIYLFHLPCIGVAYKILAVSGILQRLPVSLTYALLVVCGISGGLVLSRWVEYPLMRAVRKVLSAGSQRMRQLKTQ